MKFNIIVLILFGALAISVQFAVAQRSQDLESKKIAAQVGDHPIHMDSVDRFIATRFPNQEFTQTDLVTVRAHALEHLIRRAIIHQFLIAQRRWATPSAIKLDIETFEQQLSRAEITLDQHLAEKKISRQQFEFETAWRLSWQKYLDKTLTDANLEKHFESNRRQFDGTQLKVAQLLLKDNSEAAQRQIRQLHQQVVATPLDWTKLVSQHSQAASKDDGGEIGWIAADGPMSPDFTKAAFELDVGEVSKPIETQLGWHLIKCLEVKRGKKGPLDARAELVASAKEFLFYKLASENRDKAKIVYSSDYPRLDENGNVVTGN